ncbi:MAG: hypothetical protein KJO17_07380 [Acidimicrobiia bacterium]|nr:hypothetical protein [Acidimicrobiia bacterium]NNL71360.1 hypothetical protein [Acidimicrobiia bacterium]
MQTRARCLFGLLVIVLVAAPAFGSPDRDSFPLSTYPMFSLARPAETTVSTAVGFRADGERLTLSPRTISGTREVIQAAGTVAQAISSGTADALCREILTGAPATVAAIEIVTERYDVVAYFDGATAPLERTVHARCES